MSFRHCWVVGHLLYSIWFSCFNWMAPILGIIPFVYKSQLYPLVSFLSLQIYIVSYWRTYLIPRRIVFLFVYLFLRVSSIHTHVFAESHPSILVSAESSCDSLQKVWGSATSPKQLYPSPSSTPPWGIWLFCWIPVILSQVRAYLASI